MDLLSTILFEFFQKALPLRIKINFKCFTFKDTGIIKLS